MVSKPIVRDRDTRRGQVGNWKRFFFCFFFFIEPVGRRCFKRDGNDKVESHIAHNN